MSFLLPLGLVGLLTVPVILLLHLLRNRREQLDIPSLLFWRGLEKEQQGGKPHSIPLSLLLILQLVAAVALTCGLARPILSFALNQPEQTIFVLDMTTSMAAIDVPQSEGLGRASQRFDLARDLIKAQVQEIDENDRIAVVSLGPHPEILMTGDSAKMSTLISALDNLVPGATGANLTGALSLANGLVDPDQINRIVVLTDGDFSVDDQPIPAPRAPIDWRFIPESPMPNAGNLALLNVSARPLPDGRHRIFARVVNYWDVPVIRTVRLWANDKMVDEDVIELEAQADGTRVWTLSAATETVAVEIVESDSLPLDNRAELLLLNNALSQILLVSKLPDTLIKVLEAQPGIELTVASNWTDYDLAEFDLVVLDGLPLDLSRWPPGNLLVINPPPEHPLLSADNFVLNVRPDLTSASALLNGIDISGVYFNRVPRLSPPEWAYEPDLVTTAGEGEQPWPLIFQGMVNNSRVMVWAFELSASNLPARLALPLLTANSLSNLLAPSLPASIPLGETVALNGNFNVETPDGQRLFLEVNESTSRDYVFSRTKTPGLYRVYSGNDLVVAGFSVHAGSPQESQLGQHDWRPETLNIAESSILSAPDPDMDHQDFWPWLAAIALIIIVVEGGLAWRR